MKTLVKDIATIQTGLFAKPGGQGEVVYLQAKQFDESGQLVGTLHPDLLANEISEKHLLKANDILFAAKGNKNFATVYEGHNQAAVASTSFFVIRLTDKALTPEYLAWILNSHAAQVYLKGKAMGSSIPSISKQVLQDLEISVPSIETQHAILQITKLRNKEKVLKQKIEALRETLLQKQILNAIK